MMKSLRVRQLVPIAVAVLPAIIPLWLILSFGTNFPFWDQWFPDMAGIYIKAHQHQLTFADFAAQHNEHRILIPRLVYFVLNSLTHWNTIVEMVAAWFLVLLTSIGVLRLIQDTVVGQSPQAAGNDRFGLRVAASWFLCNLVLFTPTQTENWIWGMGLCNFMPAMFVIGAMIAGMQSGRRLWAKLLGVILCCSAATFSTGNGLVSWPLAGAVLLGSHWKCTWKQKLVILSTLVAALALNLALYFNHYVKPDNRWAIRGDESIAAMLHFFLIFLGNPFVESLGFAPQRVATICGVLLLTLFIAALAYFFARRRHVDDELSNSMLVWLAVAGYALCSAALASKARTGFGLQQALAPRYVSFSLYLPLALVPLCVIILNDIRRRFPRSGLAGSVIGSTIAAILLISQVLALPRVISFCRSWQLNRYRDLGALLLLPILPDNPQLVGAISPEVLVLTQATQLDDIGYLHPPLIRHPNAALLEDRSGKFAEGTIVNASQPDGAHVTCIGWSTFPSLGRAADAVFLTYDNQQGEPIIVAGAQMCAQSWLLPVFSDPAYECAGWVAKVSLGKIPADIKSTRLTAWALDSQTRRAYRLQGSADLQLRKE